MKTIEEIKSIWKKSAIETFTNTFTIVEETAKEESLKSDINTNNATEVNYKFYKKLIETINELC